MSKHQATSFAPLPLTVHHLRIRGRAETAIRLHEYAGSALRGALAYSLRRNYCPEWRAETTDPLHQALCPVCQILSWEGDDETSGEVRRPYTLEPPLNLPNVLEAGETFDFGLTFLGDTLAYLPYMILALHAAGQEGIGRRDEKGKRGRFVIEQIEAVNPLTHERSIMLAPGSRTVQTTTLPLTHAHVAAEAARLARVLADNGGRLGIEFLTPTRINQGEHMLKEPHFFALVKQVVLRLLDLAAQHGGGRPDIILKRDLYPFADRVTLRQNETIWWDVKGFSQRLGRSQVLGGLVGCAIYEAQDWEPLLPWLVWGQSVHVGKNAVKGCGLYRLSVDMCAG